MVILKTSIRRILDYYFTDMLGEGASNDIAGEILDKVRELVISTELVELELYQKGNDISVIRNLAAVNEWIKEHGLVPKRISQAQIAAIVDEINRTK